MNKRSVPARGDGWDAFGGSTGQAASANLLLKRGHAASMTRLTFSCRYSRILALLNPKKRVASVTSAHAYRFHLVVRRSAWLLRELAS